MRIKSYFKQDTTGDGSGGSASGDNENTTGQETQTANAKLEVANTANANIANANIEPEWKGDARYFQEGQKAGQLKPKYRTPEQNQSIKRKGYKATMGQQINKPDSTTGAPIASTEFAGLNLGDLKTTAPGATKKEEPQSSSEPAAKAKPTKAEKKLIEAKIAAKMAMRLLDTLGNWISKGQYGADFNDAQRAARNEYRESLEKDWEDYLVTLDIPMHPGLVVAFGSLMYIAPTFQTVAGEERAQTLKEKVIGKAVGWMFSKKG